MNKIIKTTIAFLAVFALIYKYFLYIDIKNNCYVKIKPSFIELSSSNIKQAIKALKYGAPEEYEKFCSNINTIDPNISCGGFQGGCYYSGKINSKEISISTANQEFLGWTAAVVAHETCHAIQYEENREMSESECYAIGYKVLKKLVEF